MALKDNESALVAEEAPPKAVALAIEAIRKHRKALRRLGVAVSLLIVGVSIFIFGRTLLTIDLGQFESAFRATGANQILAAFGLGGDELSGADRLRRAGAAAPGFARSLSR